MASFPFEASPQIWILGREERIAATPILKKNSTSL
jgi:hypothetical protein